MQKAICRFADRWGRWARDGWANGNTTRFGWQELPWSCGEIEGCYLGLCSRGCSSVDLEFDIWKTQKEELIKKGNPMADKGPCQMKTHTSKIQVLQASRVGSDDFTKLRTVRLFWTMLNKSLRNMFRVCGFHENVNGILSSPEGVEKWTSMVHDRNTWHHSRYEVTNNMAISKSFTNKILWIRNILVVKSRNWSRSRFRRLVQPTQRAFRISGNKTKLEVVWTNRTINDERKLSMQMREKFDGFDIIRAHDEIRTEKFAKIREFRKLSQLPQADNTKHACRTRI